MDPNDPLFQGYPENSTLAIQNFANAINNYAKFVVPVTTPVSQQLGVQAFITTMTSITIQPGPTFQSLFPTALTMYATQLGLGMAPAFTGSPPVTPLQLDPVWEIGLNGGTTQAVITALVPLIDAWFRTGIAVNNASGVTTTWL